jgi:hypothetical protein
MIIIIYYFKILLLIYSEKYHLKNMHTVICTCYTWQVSQRCHTNNYSEKIIIQSQSPGVCRRLPS